MAFELRVTFCGLCLYVHNSKNQVAVLMPDARRLEADPHHDDNSVGEPHVGFMRADFGAIDAKVPSPSMDKSDVPTYELVHRFDHQMVDFGLPTPTDPIAKNLCLPSLDEIAPNLDLLPGLFSANPPKPLLFRTIIEGGTLEAPAGGKTWKLDAVFAGGKELKGQYAGWVKWRRMVDAPQLNVTISDFAGGNPYTLPLTPKKDAAGNSYVELKFSNLCASNPLEWRDLPTQMVVEDTDFKWIYRLLQPQAGTLSDALCGATFPYPSSAGLSPLGGEDCIGGQKQAQF